MVKKLLVAFMILLFAPSVLSFWCDEPKSVEDYEKSDLCSGTCSAKTFTMLPNDPTGLVLNGYAIVEAEGACEDVKNQFSKAFEYNGWDVYNVVDLGVMDFGKVFCNHRNKDIVIYTTEVNAKKYLDKYDSCEEWVSGIPRNWMLIGIGLLLAYFLIFRR